MESQKHHFSGQLTKDIRSKVHVPTQKATVSQRIYEVLNISYRGFPKNR